jgi:hypothetical protein
MSILCALALLLVLEKGSQEPSIEAVQLCDNYHAQTWKSHDVMEGQIFSARYHIAHSTKLGSEFLLDVNWVDAQGKSLLHSSSKVKQLTGGEFPDFWSFFNLTAPALEPGKYELIIKVISQDETIKLESKQSLTMQPTKLGLFVCSLTTDMQGQSAALPQHLSLFQPVTMRLGICGLRVMDGKVQVRAKRQLLDSHGKVLEEITLPDHEEAALLVPGQKMGYSQVTFNITVNQPGEYRLKYIVEDLNTRDRFIKEIPVRFIAPDAP